MSTIWEILVHLSLFPLHKINILGNLITKEAMAIVIQKMTSWFVLRNNYLINGLTGLQKSEFSVWNSYLTTFKRCAVQTEGNMMGHSDFNLKDT